MKRNRKTVSFVLFAAMLLAIIIFPAFVRGNKAIAESTTTTGSTGAATIDSAEFVIGMNQYFVNNQTPGISMDAAPYIDAQRAHPGSGPLPGRRPGRHDQLGCRYPGSYRKHCRLQHQHGDRQHHPDREWPGADDGCRPGDQQRQDVPAGPVRWRKALGIRSIGTPRTRSWSSTR